MNDDERRVLPATSGRAVQVWLTVVCVLGMLAAPSACLLRHGSPASTVPPEPSPIAVARAEPTKTAASPTGTPAPSPRVETVTLYNVGDVSALAYSPDSSRLAIATDLEIRVFDAATLRQLYHLYDAYTRSLAFSADGAVLAAALYDGTIHLWEGTEGRPLPSLPWSTSTYPTLVALSPDGSTLAAATGDGTVQLWRPADWQLLRVLDTGGSIYGLAFSPDGATLSVEAGRGAQQWRVADGCFVRTIAEGSEMHPRVAFSPEGTVEACAVGGSVFVWDLVGNRPAATFLGEVVDALAVSGEGRLVATASDRVLHLWRVGDSRPLCAAQAPRGWPSALALAPDGSALALASGTEVRVWRIAGGRLASLDLPSPMPMVPAVPEGGPLPAPPGIPITPENVAQLQEVARWGNGAIRQITYSPDGSQLAVASGLGVRVCDTATYSETLVLEDGVAVGSVAFSPDGALLATTAGQEVHLWRLADRRLLRTLSSQTDEVLEVAFSPDGSTLASRSDDGALRLWCVADGQLVQEVDQQGQISSFAFSPDGKLLVVSSDRHAILLLRAADGGLVRTLDAEAELYCSEVAFSPDGAYVAGAGALGLALWRVSDGTLVQAGEPWADPLAVAFSPDGEFVAEARRRGRVDIMRTADGAHLRSLAVAGPVIDVAISPDGAVLATGSLYGTVCFWSLPEGRLLHQLGGWYNQGLTCLAISPDGALVATGSCAGYVSSVTLWQVADGRALHTFDARGHGVRAVAFSPDGSLLAAPNDYTIVLWDLPVGTLKCEVWLGSRTSRAKLAFSPDGEFILASDDGGATIYSWRVADEEAVVSSQDCGSLESFAFSPDGSALATIEYANTLRLWRSPRSASPAPAGPMPAWTRTGEPGTAPGEALTPANAGRMREVARWGRGALHGVTYSPDGRLLATGCPSGVYLFAADALGEPRLLDAGMPASRVAFSPDGALVGASSADGIHFWRTADLQPVHTIARPGLSLEGFLPGGTGLIGIEGGIIRVYRVPGEPSAPAAPARPTLATAAAAPIRPDDMGRLVPASSWDGGYVRDVAYSADGRLLAMASPAGLALYDTSSLEAVRVLPGADYRELAFAARGDVLLACSGSFGPPTVRYSATVWQVDSGRVIGEFPAPQDAVATYALSPAGDLLAAALGEEGISLWRLADGELLYCQPAIDKYALSALTFSADGTLLAIGLEDGTIRLVRLPEGTVVREIVSDQDGIGSLCFSPDGALLASCASRVSGLRLWRVADGCLLNNPDDITGYSSGASFSPDGALLAWTGERKVYVSRASDGQVLYTLDEASVWGGSIFSPDGRVLVTRGEGIRLWDAADGRLLATLSGHQGRISGAVLSPDGRSLASWSSDGEVRLWAVR